MEDNFNAADGVQQTQDPVDPGVNTSIQDGTEHFSAENWRDYIPEDLRDRQEWGRVDSIQDVFKNYIEGQKTISSL